MHIQKIKEIGFRITGYLTDQYTMNIGKSLPAFLTHYSFTDIAFPL
jgi:hypothetical protein